jgi:ribosomal protein S18 acetylase RimI-like enzyme
MIMVNLRPMTLEEFVLYEDADAHQYAENMVKAGFWSPEGALNKAKETHAQILPNGLYTRDHFFFVIEDDQNNNMIGTIWLFIDRQIEPPSGFIYDLLVYTPFRGQGLGRQAMLALERKAQELGLASLTLHVFEDNIVAKALYTSLGYQVQSLNMRKILPAARKDRDG